MRYIEEYGNEDDHNPMVLEFAMFDYNKVQSILKGELDEVTRWWEHLGLTKPSFSGSTIELAKAIAILLVIDDIYDTYGSYDDLILFIEAIKRDMYGIGASFLSDIKWGYIRKCTTSS
ncbi:hypothetical protein L1987_33149 [Smallanthus sonchifolius]|uniref:Uncharacterized protein n=1 Tax=Smallanthus sonchifolius TaxID=185202 RepID=A0ACB9HRX6_9ASTR|nr:hypothetical protein L1987_33149 [Smallanthus sonchifolius]